MKKKKSPPLAKFDASVEPAAIPVGFLCIVSGILTDTDGTPWINAPWTVTAISPSSPPVFIDGTPVPAMFGNLDDTGAFNAYVPRTDFIQPAGTRLRFTIHSVTSEPPLVVNNILSAAPTLNLGAELSPVPAPRIQAGPLVYAYSQTEVINPVNGNGYVNTSDLLAFIWQGFEWVPIDSGPAGQIYPPAGVAVSTGSAWAASIPPASLAGFPPVGVPVSTGTAWAGTSIPQAVIARTDLPATWTASLIVNGDFTASGVKLFRIPHPLDQTKDLVHACIEGPEAAVFYRGEGVTKAGIATVMLPDYFEALTRKDGRTVQITALVDDDNPVFGGQIAAGRVSGGKFNVYSEDTSQAFHWEVKAVRLDVPQLTVAVAVDHGKAS